MLDQIKFFTQIESIAESVIRDEKASRGWHADIRVQRDRLPDCARLLLDHEFSISFMTAVDVSPEIEVLYQFAHFDAPCIVVVRASTGADKTVPSIAAVYDGAAWHEREAYDFFGINFTGHPHLKPLILSREDNNLNPLLKDEKRLKSYADIFAPPAPAQSE